MPDRGYQGLGLGLAIVRHAAADAAVALTALARDDDRRRILSAGFQKHVPKPVTAAQLVKSVASLRPRHGA